ncbi:TetR/AcrR family transcriptional regulator [Rhabdothermincola sp.]|uniref:TetR/AcrR family transcriptional regulator n=1 Tax=Rhabdothermincola sp. TaxID=2820405 RepID=UPI002FDFF7D9
MTDGNGDPPRRPNRAGRDRAASVAAERERRRQQLLDAAVALVRREGPYASMEQIAAECGITKPILYRHFGDRQGLIMAVAEGFVSDLIAELAPSLVSTEPPRRLLERTIDAYLGLIERDTNLYRFLSAHADPGKRDLLTALIAEEIAIVFERVLADTGLDPADGKPWAYGVVGMVHLAGDWWVESRALSRDRLVDRLTTLLWSGFEGIGLPDQRPTVTPRTPSPEE